MTTITLPRATVEQALEALEAFLSDELRPYEAAKTSDALRAALAQQAEPVQEPDYWQEEARRYAGNADYWRKRYEALAEPVDTDCHTQGICQRSGYGIGKQTEPVELKHRHEWFRTGGMEPGQFRCIHCGAWGQEQSDPQIEDRLARHGIPKP